MLNTPITIGAVHDVLDWVCCSTDSSTAPLVLSFLFFISLFFLFLKLKILIDFKVLLVLSGFRKGRILCVCGLFF